MIKPKQKTCLGCGQLKILWLGKPHCLCKDCAAKKKLQEQGTVIQKQREPINRQSDKRKKLDAIYNIAAAQFKKAKPECLAKLPGCVKKTSDIHHLHSGKDKAKYYLDQTTWITVCISCHHKIHNVLGKEELIKLGLKRIEA